jgi:ABC-type branched-subunit amino acid transport system substrate-binding protein
MQVLKKFSVILGCFLICSCTFLQRSSYSESYYGYLPSNQLSRSAESTDYTHVDLGNAGSFRVAMLLPLSGNVAAMGQSMKNAATMAIGDIGNNNLVVQFYDTKGTSSGARVAVENAINADSDLILGPLLSEEVSAISNEARSKDIPVISFSTSPAVLQEGVYTLGLLNNDQISRMIKYAASQGRKRLAAVLPDNQSGTNMFRSIMTNARENGVTVVKVGFYAPDSMDFTSLVMAMKTGGVDFDALLIPETGNRLKAISSMFSYYDVAAPNVLFMGTSVWDSSNLSKETELYGAVYPVMSLQNQESFAQKYNELFDEKPSGLSIYAYDAIALASSLATKDRDYINENIVRPDGYVGMSGTFRIFADGQNEHALDVVKVTSGGKKVVEEAPSQFYGAYASPEPKSGSNYYGYGYVQQMPKVYGRTAEQMQNILTSIQ